MAKRDTAWARRRDPCYYCRRIVDPNTQAKGETNHRYLATLDHKFPKARGGSNHHDNLVMSCGECNRAKGDMTAEEFFHFVEHLEFAESYVVWLETNKMRQTAGTIKRVKGRGPGA